LRIGAALRGNESGRAEKWALVIENSCGANFS
jgi:hypothetical protein